LRGWGIEYVLGVRKRPANEVRNEVIEDDRLAVPLVIPRQKGETELAIKKTTLKLRTRRSSSFSSGYRLISSIVSLSVSRDAAPLPMSSSRALP
jgi:hypothetical protein